MWVKAGLYGKWHSEPQGVRHSVREVRVGEEGRPGFLHKSFSPTSAQDHLSTKTEQAQKASIPARLHQTASSSPHQTF